MILKLFLVCYYPLIKGVAGLTVINMKNRISETRSNVS